MILLLFWIFWAIKKIDEYTLNIDRYIGRNREQNDKIALIFPQFLTILNKNTITNTYQSVL